MYPLVQQLSEKQVKTGNGNAYITIKKTLKYHKKHFCVLIRWFFQTYRYHSFSQKCYGKTYFAFTWHWK